MKGGGASVTSRTGSSVRLSLSGDIRQASGLIGGSSLSIPGAFGGVGRGKQNLELGGPQSCTPGSFSINMRKWSHLP